MSSSSINAGRTSDLTGKTFSSTSVVEQVLLPTLVVEKPVAVHEEIRKELIEEIQPVVSIEKLKTEVHQVTQPLFDKEVRPVLIQKKVLNTEILPELSVQGRGMRAADDISTVRMLDTTSMTFEKPAIFNEIERKQVIEEIQPVIYKETVMPTVIQETKPIYQKVVEGAVYSQETLSAKSIRSEEEMLREAELNAYRPSSQVVAPTKERMLLPTQIIEKPVAIHEQIRNETIEEIQPVVNIEKIKTEVHQITAPLFDKEVMPVLYEKKVLDTKILPELSTLGHGARMAQDLSSVRSSQTSMTIERPAIFTEVDKTQIIEEIQPVVYKETVLPTVIQETKPIYQKIVEGAVYSQETLPMKGIRSEETMQREAQLNAYRPSSEIIAPVQQSFDLPTQIIEKPVAVHEEIRKELIEEIQPVVNIEKLSTEIHQVTQPLFDKEVRPVLFEKKMLNAEILPEVLVEGRGSRSVLESSTTNYLNTETIVIEKDAQIIEIEKTQIIEEVQPVVYKQTIVPTVIQETKPIYQKVVEGVVYSHSTLAPQSVADYMASHPGFSTSNNYSSSSSSTMNSSSLNNSDSRML